MAQAQPFEVHYHPHINVDVTPSWDNLNYEHCTTDDGINILKIPRCKRAPHH